MFRFFPQDGTFLFINLHVYFLICPFKLYLMDFLTIASITFYSLSDYHNSKLLLTESKMTGAVEFKITRDVCTFIKTTAVRKKMLMKAKNISLHI